jgi:hypothetical protein
LSHGDHNFSYIFAIADGPCNDATRMVVSWYEGWEYCTSLNEVRFRNRTVNDRLTSRSVLTVCHASFLRWLDLSLETANSMAKCCSDHHMLGVTLLHTSRFPDSQGSQVLVRRKRSLRGAKSGQARACNERSRQAEIVHRAADRSERRAPRTVVTAGKSP